MSDLLKVIIGLALWLLMFLLMYNSGLKPECSHVPFCGSDKQVATAAPPVKQVEDIKRAPLDCQWSDATGYTNDGFEAFKTDLLSGLGDNNILEIVGLYYDGEDNNTEFGDMGLARANQLKSLFAEEIGEDRIQLSSVMLNHSETAKEGYYTCAEFNWLEGEIEAEATGPVEILDDRVIIRFPYNSVEKDVDPTIDAYLEELATELKASGASVRLTGHTDNKGNEERNETLAHRRAKMIRDILRTKGVKRSQISTFTMGENDPITSNDTEEGRHQNRRVEVQVDN